MLVAPTGSMGITLSGALTDLSRTTATLNLLLEPGDDVAAFKEAQSEDHQWKTYRNSNVQRVLELFNGRIGHINDVGCDVECSLILLNVFRICGKHQDIISTLEFPVNFFVL